MNLGTLLNSLLASTFAGKFYVGMAPDTAGVASAGPYAIYMHFGNRYKNLRGSTDKQPQTVQIDIYAATYIAAEALKETVIALMEAQSVYASPNMFTSTTGMYHYMGVDPKVKLHRVTQEFNVWYQP